jgi:hypothetical protein
MLAASPHPHPTIILTTRLISHHEHGHKTATHAILMKNNHNKHPTQQHALRKIIEELPKVIPT